MGFSDSDSSKCRRHPNPRQLPGVCPSCLREKLSKLDSTTAATTTITAASSSSSALSSTSTTTTSSSTTAHSRHHRRNGSEVPSYVSVGMVLNTGLKKSRSVSCAPLSCRSIRDKTIDGKNNNVHCNNIKRIIKNNNNHDDTNNNSEKGDNCEEKEGEIKTKKKLGGGFLKKLIHTTSKKTKGALKHSKTMKERSTATAQSHQGDNTAINCS